MSSDYPDAVNPLWQPAWTEREAALHHITKQVYRQAVLFSRRTAKEHQQLGTPRHLWEPTSTQNAVLAGPFISDGEKLLSDRLVAEVDPALDEAQVLVENVKASFDGLAEDRPPILTPNGQALSVAKAVEVVRRHEAKIERDNAAGMNHHRRSSTTLMQIGWWAPWIEAIGFLAFVSYYLNVPLLAPWTDWLGWTFAISIVVFIILGQSILVHQAADSHKHAREAYADGNDHEAERELTRRNLYIGFAGIVALAITSAMVLRGLAALGAVGVATTLVVVFLAAVTGVVMPSLIYLGSAFDGSRVSLERDSLVADLNDDLGSYTKAIADRRRDLAAVSKIRDTLDARTLPDIHNDVQVTVDGACRLQAVVRLLIGGLATDPPGKTLTTVTKDIDGNIFGHISPDMPGAGSVSLGPMFDRRRRLGHMDAGRTELLHGLESLRPHPWGRSLTS
jgi:hypothetical protein